MEKVPQVGLQQIVIMWLFWNDNWIGFLSCGSYNESGNQYKFVWSHVWKFCPGSPVMSQLNTSVSPSSNLLALRWHYSFSGWLAKMNKNVLQMACGKVGSSGLANSAFKIQCWIWLLQCWIWPKHCGFLLGIALSLQGRYFKRYTELCYTGNASWN